MQLKTHFIGKAIMIGILMLVSNNVYANWGWESSDDPKPYYHQEWGKWYHYDETKVFMVQIDDKTYKYVFDYNEKFMGGWMTDMPMRLN